MQPPTAVRRQLNTWDGIALFVGIIVGSGIFFAPSAVAGAAPGLLAAIALWAVGGITAAAGALCYAECGARLPENGGFYLYYRAVFGEALAFVGGWAAMLVTYPASIAVMALVFGSYLGQLLPPLAELPAAGGAIVILVAAAVNVIGVRTGALAQRLLTAAKVGTIVLVVTAALVAGARPEAATAPLAFEPGRLVGALVAVLWTYSGWSDVSLVTGELRDPARSLGKTVLWGTLILVALYALVQVAVSAVLPADVAGASERVFAETVSTALGPELAGVVAAMVVLSTLGAINGTTLAASRLGWSMAKDGLMPRWLGQLHPKLGTPATSIGALAAASLLYLFASSFQALLGLFTFSIWIFYALTAVALLVMRRRRLGEPLAWRAPLGPTSPLVVIATSVAMTALLLADREQHDDALKGALLLSTGFPAWALWKRLSPHRSRSFSADRTRA